MPLVLPTGKHDLEAARALRAASYEEVKDLVPGMLEWVADPNWPVARELYPALIQHGDKLAAHVESIFLRSDYTWTYSLLLCLLPKSPSLATALAPWLTFFACDAGDAERQEELHLQAREVIAALPLPAFTPAERIETGAAMRWVQQRLNVQLDDGFQDWAIHFATPAMFAEALALYPHAQDDDQRFALGSVLFASLDEAFTTEHSAKVEPLVSRFARIVRRDADIHASHVHYWSVADETDVSNLFAVSPLARALCWDLAAAKTSKTAQSLV